MRSKGGKVYDVRFSRRADSYFQRLDEKTKARIIATLDILALDPWENHLDIKPLEGCPGEFRLRIGDYRLIYTVEDDVLIIYVLKLNPRGDVYKK